MGYRLVFSQMFDVRPRNRQGQADVEKISRVQEILDLAQWPSKEGDFVVAASRVFSLREKRAIRQPSLMRVKKRKEAWGESEDNDSLGEVSPEEKISEYSLPTQEEILSYFEQIEQSDNLLKQQLRETVEIQSILKDQPAIEEKDSLNQELPSVVAVSSAAPPTEAVDFPFIPDQSQPVVFIDAEAGLGLKASSASQSKRQKFKKLKRKMLPFVSVGLFLFLLISGLSVVGHGILARGNILGSALEAWQAMLAGRQSAGRLDFSSAQVSFQEAYQNFWQAEQELNKMGRSLIYILERLPGGSVVSSGAALVRVGEDLAQAGQSFSRLANLFLAGDKNLSSIFPGDSFTQKIVQAQKEIQTIGSVLISANQNLGRVNSADLPPEMSDSVRMLQEKIPAIAEATRQLESWGNVFLTVLGHERAKKYLLIFQNNSEARPTGGFVGTYGVLDLDAGRVKNLFIDGIFNLDGQLQEKIIPPKPIQKISTAWSAHDANWFADFPTSAKKMMWFYEKAGGATVDGVISLTPTVVERLLALTGPIDLPEYNVSLNADNFLDIIQYKVEVDYDKAQNQPKKILADFAPQFLDYLWQVWPEKSQEILQVFIDMLSQKQILFYFTNDTLEKVFIEQGWGGNILETDKDYLSVVNTNINGFKTDKVVEQKIEHQSAVQPDGAIIDTVKIIRSHQGGQSQYDWHNRVNADYLRVYVPLGSRLLVAQGHTLEVYTPPVDYAKLGFRQDAEVAAQEESTAVDQNSGTQVFVESGKTVFANWVYVSPGESVEVNYQYLLPFKLDLSAQNASYSLLIQKQAGSLASGFESILRLPSDFSVSWQYPESLEDSGKEIKFSSDLSRDRFYGAVFSF